MCVTEFEGRTDERTDTGWPLFTSRTSLKAFRVGAVKQEIDLINSGKDRDVI